MAVETMGLTFPNPIGLAAGFDRSGVQAALLARLGFGHIEIGTFQPGQALATDDGTRAWRLGINIGSAGYGLDPWVVEDYGAALRRAYGSADYLCANLSSPFAGRHADSRGVDALIGRLKRELSACAKESKRSVPLLLKIESWPDGSLWPAAIPAARHHGFDGLVVVSASVERVEAIARYCDGLTIISVGGVMTSKDARARLEAGASLVQIYTFFARYGAAGLRRMLAELAIV